MPILDQFGRPILQKVLEKEVAEAQSIGVRQPLHDLVSNGLTPGELATILADSAAGELDAYLSLAEEMEERYLHYSGVLTARKLAVAGAPLLVEPYDESARAVEIAETFEKEVVKKPEFFFFLLELLDALGKSFSVIEPIWDLSTRPWTIKEYQWKDPHWFHFDRVSHRKLRLKSQTNYDGEELPGGAFIVHYPRIKCGLPARGGLARVASIAFMAQNYTLKDWLAFMEVYGMPLRIGKYDPNTVKEPERLTLRTALANLGHDAAAMIPEGMDIEIHDIKRGSGNDSLFGGLCDYLDKQVSKGVLGQTMTTDNGSSLAQAKVHQDVSQSFREADATGLAATVNQGLTRQWCQLNFGENCPVCSLKIDVSEPEDLESFTKTALPWVEKAGLRVGAAWLRDKLGIPDPDEDGENEILGGEPETEPETEPESDPYEVQGPPEVDANGDPIEPTPEEIPPVARQAASVDNVIKITDRAIEHWAQVMEPYRVAIEKLSRNSANYDEFLVGLDGLVAEFDSNPFVRMLAVEMAKARGVGASRS